MKKLLLLPITLAISSAYAVDAPGGTVILDKVPAGITVKRTLRKTNVTPSILMTHNPNITVSVNPPPVPIEHAMHAGIPVEEDETKWPAVTWKMNAGEGLTAFGSSAIPPVVAEGNEGAFRNRCGLSKFSWNDPIVYPGQPNKAHHHTFFGHTGIDAFTTTANIRAPGASTSCRGGRTNLSGYWSGSLIDIFTRLPIKPLDVLLYYKATGLPYFGALMVNGKKEYPRTTPFPVGFRMIAGQPGAMALPNPAHFSWSCFIPSPGGNREGTSGPTIPPVCGPGDQLRVRIDFPMCWDGVNLDSPDHKSHMAYPVRMPGTQIYYDPYKPYMCPTTHPKVMPQLSYTVNYPIPAGTDLTKWRLAADMYSVNLPGGWSMHADFLNGHDPEIQAIWVRECLGGDRGYNADGTQVPRTLRDCGSATIGDTRSLIALD